MLIAAFATLVGAFLFFYYFYPEIPSHGVLHGHHGVGIAFTIMGACCGLVLGMLISIVGSELYYDSTEKYRSISQTEQIYSVFNNDSMSGSFFLGIGSVDSKNYYYYYTQEDRGYKRNKLNGEFHNVYINEKDDIKNPSVKLIEYIPKKNWAYYMFITPNRHPKTVIFNVPEGTIFKDFNVK